ncbi:hypothetical protein CDD81_1814 [Ophiocordyceps australis]|uniref:Crh-like protein n=1 Tax=Ophiocordyceps australis TaxID=1399860 RepID=A0A2C5XY70_9HYPO|nr:hypothetical protein CDD81_1814 [Ophiocordyceps australis]
MLSKPFSAATLALAASSLVSAQTFSECNPTKKTCPPNPALGSKVDCDFTKGDCGFFGKAVGTDIKHNGNGAEFSISQDSDAPTIRGNKYIFFGRVDVEAQAAPGRGIVTSVVLLSDDLDEIDWEWLGGDAGHVQTNYFSKGDTSVYDRSASHPVAAATTQFHKYSIEWTSSAIVWSIDGQPVRTLASDAAKGGAAFPQTPMQVKLGTWVAGRKDAPEGTVTWAGGRADYSQSPFVGYYKSISIVDYAGKDKPANGGIKEYVYGDQSGSKQSIKIVPGNSDDAVKDRTSSKDGKDDDDDKFSNTKSVEMPPPGRASTTSNEPSASLPAATSAAATSAATPASTPAASNKADTAVAGLPSTSSPRPAPLSTLAASASGTASRVPALSDRLPTSAATSSTNPATLPGSAAAPRHAASLSAALIAFAALLL